MPIVKLSSKALKGYETLSTYRHKINSVLDTIETNPYPFHYFDLKKLKGVEDAYGIRVGKIRVKYKVLEQERVVLVYYIGPREGAYD